MVTARMTTNPGFIGYNIDHKEHLHWKTLHQIMMLVATFLATLAQSIFTSASPGSGLSIDFDYVIVGGGTCGLVLANRLSEDPKVTVAVIEAGDSVYDNPNVKNTTAYGLSLGTAVDWQYASAPQIYSGNNTLLYHQGKALGGSSAINGLFLFSIVFVSLLRCWLLGMIFSRPESVQVMCFSRHRVLANIPVD